MPYECRLGRGLKLDPDGWYCLKCKVRICDDPTLSGPKLTTLWYAHINDDPRRVLKFGKNGKSKLGTPPKRDP